MIGMPLPGMGVFVTMHQKLCFWRCTKVKTFAIAASGLFACPASAQQAVESLALFPNPGLQAPAPPEIVTPPAISNVVASTAGEDLWHLRSALNVAALLCDAKVFPGLINAYNRILSGHKTLLAKAAETEMSQFRAQGGKKAQSLYDSHMTKLYNQYSIVPDRQRFCTAATDTADAASKLTSATLSTQAPTLIRELNFAADIK